MNSRLARFTQRNLTTALRGVLLAGGCLWAIWIAWPLPEWNPPSAGVSPPTQTRQAPVEPPIDIDRVCRRNLRQPLTDVPPPVETPTPEQPLSVRLAGTAVGTDHRYGVFILANNTTVLKEVGATIDGYELIAIERGLARLRLGQRNVELRVPRYEQLVAEAAP